MQQLIFWMLYLAHTEGGALHCIAWEGFRFRRLFFFKNKLSTKGTSSSFLPTLTTPSYHTQNPSHLGERGTGKREEEKEKFYTHTHTHK